MSWSYFFIFLQSNLLEVPFYYLFFKRHGTFLQILAWTTAINSITHPLVFFLFMNLPLNYLPTILLAESFAIISETLFFFYFLKIGWIAAFRASVISNLISWQIAPITTYLFLLSFS